jgi:hypothetical protein
MKNNKLINSKFNSSINEWQNSIYMYNEKNINFSVHNSNKILYSLLDNYFNLNNNFKDRYNSINFINSKINTTNIALMKDFFDFNKFSNIIAIKKKYELEMMEKNHFYKTKRKSALSIWKNELLSNKNNNIINNKGSSVLSLKRTFINLPSIKHSNNSILITMHVFNKNKVYFKNKLSKLKLLFKFNKSNKEILNNLKFKLLKINFNSNIELKKRIYTKPLNYNLFLLKTSLGNSISNKSLNSFFKRTYLANIYLNNFRHNILNLINLKNIIAKIYQKKVILNITNLKYVYLENNIFVDNLMRKLNDRKKGVLRVLKKALKLIKIADMDPILFLKNNRMMKYIDNILILRKYINYMNEYAEEKYKTILNSIRNIHTIGVSLEAKGRLTKRMTASRSVHKLKYKGNLKNVYSAYYKMSIPLLRGFMKSNINFVKNNSKNKNGSYGISSSLNTF